MWTSSVVLLLQAVVWAAPASADVTCSYDAQTDTVRVRLTGFVGKTIFVADPVTHEIQVDGTDCGGATTANTDLVVVRGDATDNRFSVSNAGSGGAFPATVSFSIRLGDGLDQVGVLGTGGGDDYVLVDGSLDMDGSAVLLRGIELFEFRLGEGNDRFDASTATVDIRSGAVFGVTGGGGDDQITGGQGDDSFEGDDTHDDSVVGGDDSLTGGAGRDTVVGNGGDDVIAGGEGDDAVFEGEFHDMGVGGGADVLDGGGQDGDRVSYWHDSSGTEVIVNDGTACSGRDENGDGDACDPGDERDAVSGFTRLEARQVILKGMAGVDETFTIGTGTSAVTGNPGDEDTLEFGSDATGAVVDVAAGTAGGFGTFTDVDNFIGTEVDDLFMDDQSVDNTYFFDGIEAGDRYDQGSAAGTDGDVIVTGFGDIVDYGDRTENLTVTIDDGPNDGGVNEHDDVHGGGCLAGGSGDDELFGLCSMGGPGGDLLTGSRLSGGPGSDTLNGTAHPDTLNGGAGSDVLNGGAGHDDGTWADEEGPVLVDLANGTATTPSGEDTIAGIESVTGSAFADTLVGNVSANGVLGGAGADLILPGGGDDSVAAGFGDDIVRAGEGDDSMFGMAGHDRLFGGPGTDSADGGPGTDMCRAETEVSCRS